MSYYTPPTTSDNISYASDQPSSFASLLASSSSNIQQLSNDNMLQSPLNYNSILNNPRPNANLNLSGNYSMTPNLQNSNYQSLALSSENSSLNSLYSIQRTRFMCSKGFELEDDIEFCPEIVQTPLLSSPNDKFNIYNSAPFTPQTSPSSNEISPQLSNSITTTATTTANNSNSNLKPTLNYSKSFNGIITNSQNRPLSPNPTSSPRSHTPRVKKVLEIVNPHTGMKIGSPQQSNLQVAK